MLPAVSSSASAGAFPLLLPSSPPPPASTAFFAFLPFGTFTQRRPQREAVDLSVPEQPTVPRIKGCAYVRQQGTRHTRQSEQQSVCHQNNASVKYLTSIDLFVLFFVLGQLCRLLKQLVAPIALNHSSWRWAVSRACDVKQCWQKKFKRVFDFSSRAACHRFGGFNRACETLP